MDYMCYLFLLRNSAKRKTNALCMISYVSNHVEKKGIPIIIILFLKKKKKTAKQMNFNLFLLTFANQSFKEISKIQRT